MMAVSDDCTALTSLTLREVTRRINIGREEFWGATSDTWLALFYVHCVVFIILFTIIIFWCLLFLWEKLQAWRRESSFLYLLCIYCLMWSFSGTLQYILLAVDLSQSPNEKLATATYSFEMITVASSMNGLLLVAVYQYYRLRFYTNKSIIRYILCTGPSLIIVVIIIGIISSLVGSLAIVGLVVFILVLTFIGMIGTTSLVAMYTELWYRTKSSRSLHGSTAGRILIRRMIFRLISYFYLALVPVQLLTPFVALANKSDCIEEAKGNRAVWLVIQTFIKFAELLLVAQCLSVPQWVQRLFRNLWYVKSTVKQSVSIDFSKHIPVTVSLDNLDPLISEGTFPTKSSSDANNDSPEAVLQSNTTVDELIGSLQAVTVENWDSASTESTCELAECIDTVPCDATLEREILPNASSNCVDDKLEVQPHFNTKAMQSENLECGFQDNQLLNSVIDELHNRFNHYICTPSLSPEHALSGKEIPSA